MQKIQITTSRLAVVLALLCGGLVVGLKSWIQKDSHQAYGVVKGDPVALASRSVLNAITAAGNRLVAVGENGIVLVSDDSGRAWRSAQVPVRSTLTAVRFFDRQLGIAVGHQGVILRTADGGNTWRMVADDADTSSPPLLTVEWINSTTAIALGGFGKSLMSKDAGLTWIPMQDELPNSSERHLYGYAATGSASLIAGESGTLIRRDAQSGETTLLPSPYEGSFFGALAVENDLLVFGLRGSVFTSPDGGLSWVPCTAPTQASVTAASTSRQGDILLTTMDGEVLQASGHGCRFAPIAMRYPGPATGLIAAPDGSIVLVGARGVVRENQVR